MSPQISSIPLFVISDFSDYELLDSGDGEKLERFGSVILSRPEPQAIWGKKKSVADWNRLADASFRRIKEARQGSFEGERGEWVKKHGVPDQWQIRYKNNKLDFPIRLGLTSFGHTGIFPEQAPNWNYIAESIADIHVNGSVKILNLFAYTGAASLAAASAGAEVWHVDSVKPVITWARENALLGGFEKIHWVVEDARKFVQREVRRENKYHGIILDPPAYGRGPDGEKWVLEEHLFTMVEMCQQLLSPVKGSFILLNMYSLGHSAIIAHNLVNSEPTLFSRTEVGELVIPESGGRLLPLGIFSRVNR